MKNIAITREAVFSSAARLSHLTRSDQIGPELEPDAATLASGLSMYTREQPRSGLRLLFILSGHFDPESPYSAVLRKFVRDVYSPRIAAPIAEAAMAHLYAGPKRPDAGMHRTADFLHGILPHVELMSPAVADLAVDAVLMHSDARPARKDAAAKLRREIVQAQASKDLAKAGVNATAAIVSGGSQLTPESKNLLRFLAGNLEGMSKADEYVGMMTPITALYYATPGSQGHRWAEDRLNLVLHSTSRVPDKSEQVYCIPVALALAEAGDPDRVPAQTAQKYLRVLNSNLPKRSDRIDELLASTPDQRARIAEQTRRNNRNQLRAEQGESLLKDPKTAAASAREALKARLWASNATATLN
jgi:hypothetical protein